ncbi:MAG: hypothetical protein J6U26_02105, partial [Lachnospiraceae bacterium]|nr:hypothetical protein [Lachnospiraceae bacterium]
ETVLRYYDASGLRAKPLRAAMGIMGAANMIGTEWCAANYALLQEVLRGEWGFEGVVITDMALQLEPGVVDKIFRNGGDLRMYYYMKMPEDTRSPEALQAFRRALKNVCYAYANSNLLQGIAPGVTVSYTLPPWQAVLYGADALLLLADAVLLIFFLVRRKRGEIS